MTLFRKFMLAFSVTASCVLLILLIGAGVFLTLLTVTTGAVLYYPLTAVDWLVNKMRRVQT